MFNFDDIKSAAGAGIMVVLLSTVIVKLTADRTIDSDFQLMAFVTVFLFWTVAIKRGWIK